MIKHTLASLVIGLSLLMGATTGAWAADYLEGIKAAQRGDYVAALQQWRPLAEQGLPIAQKALGEMYYDGRGVLQNHVMAHMWFNVAASNGYEFASLYRDRLAKLMTAADISKAQQLAIECVARNYKGC